MTYTNSVINDKAAQSRAKSVTKKELLRREIFELTGWMPNKSLSMKEMKQAAGI